MGTKRARVCGSNGLRANVPRARGSRSHFDDFREIRARCGFRGVLFCRYTMLE